TKYIWEVLEWFYQKNSLGKINPVKAEGLARSARPSAFNPGPGGWSLLAGIIRARSPYIIILLSILLF
ncbi:MAG: hypothetical protein LBB11_03775, partial [Puniceicoccales bacterium]|nr:hypothetical protein [Puniceicoccales bacterium]